MRRKSTTTILKEAREILSRRGGWIQGHYADEETCARCSMGALYESAVGTPYGGGPDTNYENMLEAERLLEDIVQEREGLRRGIIQYNDTFGRTKRQILSLFDRAIKRSETR